MKFCILSLFVPVFLGSLAHSQWRTQESEVKASLRGLSIVSERIVWASGSSGTWLRTTDGGESWQHGIVAGAEHLDFRDVEAFNASTALLLASGQGDGSRIYKTTDGGANWKLLFTNPDAEGFLDCMAFWNQQRGIVVGDPVGGAFVVMLTSDGGQHWTRVSKEKLPPPRPGEGVFAASGTCVAIQGKENAWFGTATAARVYRTTNGGRTWSVADTTVANGSDSSGVTSLVFWSGCGVAVGGDYKHPEGPIPSAAITEIRGRLWEAPETQPFGYRSAVTVVPQTSGPTLVAVGTSGSDLSFDGGLHWRKLDSKGFNAVAFISPTAGWAVGGGGTIARFSGTDADGLTLSLKQQPKPTSEREIRHSICQKSSWSWVPIM